MARKPAGQFPDAMYHVIKRGDGRRKWFHDHGHYQRFTEGLEAEVLRSQWQIIRQKGTSPRSDLVFGFELKPPVKKRRRRNGARDRFDTTTFLIKTQPQT